MLQKNFSIIVEFGKVKTPIFADILFTSIGIDFIVIDCGNREDVMKLEKYLGSPVPMILWIKKPSYLSNRMFNILKDSMDNNITAPTVDSPTIIMEQYDEVCPNDLSRSLYERCLNFKF
jgi:hypothetical protein